MKQVDIKDLSVDDLTEKLQEQKDTLSKMKLSHSVSPIENPMQIKQVRRTVARLNTELRKRKNRKTTLLSQFSNDDKTYEIPSDDLEIGQQVQTDVVNEIIKDAVNQLSEKFKIVIILRDIQEISYEEISGIIGVPIGTVKSRINRARLQLQVELKHLRE